jgi:hypothetical protein
MSTVQVEGSRPLRHDEGREPFGWGPAQGILELENPYDPVANEPSRRVAVRKLLAASLTRCA